MRRILILTPLAALIGMAAGFAGASAHDYDDDDYDYSSYKERWYQAYERRRAAAEDDRLEREQRAYERFMNDRRRRPYYDAHDYGRYHHGHHYDWGRHRSRHYRYSYASYHYGYDYSAYHFHKPRYDYWDPKYYRTGGSAWWKRMDKQGRGGQQD